MYTGQILPGYKDSNFFNQFSPGQTGTLLVFLRPGQQVHYYYFCAPDNRYTIIIFAPGQQVHYYYYYVRV